MGFRFRRSMSIIPGLRLNFGKRGVSMSLGPRGAKLTVGPSGTRATVGIPGTGLSYTEKLGEAALHHPDDVVPAQTAAGSSFNALGWVVAAILFLILLAVLL